MSRPYTVHIGPHNFAVHSNNNHTHRLIRDGKYGETDLDKLSIYIRHDLPASLWDETLCHEVIHAAFAVSGLNHQLDDEERIVATLAPYLSQALSGPHLPQP